VKCLPYDRLTQKAERAKLAGFDAILWNMPGSNAIAWMEELRGRVPQIIINRHLPGFNYVSTDHHGAIYDITQKRLQAVPQATPVFLSTDGDTDSPVWQMRYEGFVDACREGRHFYETLCMPADFEAKIQFLESHLSRHLGTPLLLVSGALANTGAVATWVRERKLRWKKDVFYSDFDDDQPLNTWGVKITSFLQDYTRMTTLAMEKLPDLIAGETDQVQLLLPPVAIEGDT
jgi:DNA-binding LacI/PurR family transcriptional regulator